jgi:hypothetical protein
MYQWYACHTKCFVVLSLSSFLDKLVMAVPKVDAVRFVQKILCRQQSREEQVGTFKTERR